MSCNIQQLRSSLVKIKSKYTGSGVWLNLGFTEHSYVLTAEHNIDGKELKIFDHNGIELNSTYLCSLAGMDIAIIKIEGQCNNQVELCLDELEITSLQSTCWILGYPQSLVTTSDFDSTEHQGRISLDNDKILFQISDQLPDDDSYIKGFSGGPIFEIMNGVTYLKGIITDRFDENFAYKKIYGSKSSAIYDELPEEVKEELICKNTIEKIVTESCDKLDGKVGEYISDSKLLEKLDSINLDELKNCKYFYLPNDKPKTTQHLSLLRNKSAIEAYIHTRILSLMMDEQLSNINLNPSNYESNTFFTIHVTDFTKAHQLVAKLIRQENSLDFYDAIFLVIYSNKNNDLSYVSKRRVSRIISNFSEGKVPDLFDTSAPPREKGLIRDFLNTRKKAGLKFAVFNIKYLIETILQHIEDELYDEKYCSDILKQEVIKTIKQYE
jgi:hypothetical protein